MSLTEKQLKMRRTGIGASEIAALAGLSKYSTPIQIYERKVGLAPAESSLRMDLGDLLEEPIAQLYARRTGTRLRKCVTLRHRTHEIALATPDRAVFRGEVPAGLPIRSAERLLQIKTTGWRQRDEWGREGTDEIPEDYLAQVQWEMDVADVPLCDVAVLVDRDEFLVYTVARDPELVAGLHEVAARFWQDHVLPQRPPPPDASERYAEYLGRAFPREQSELLKPAPLEIEATALALRGHEAAIKDLTQLAEVEKNTLRAFIGEATGVTGSFGRITWKAARGSTRVDWEAAFNAAPLDAATREQLITAHTHVTAGSRRLLKTWAK